MHARFLAIELGPGPAAAEGGHRQPAGHGGRGLGRQVVAAAGHAAEDRQAPAAGQDLAAGAAFGGVGPGVGMLAPVEEPGEDAGHVGPVVRVIGLDEEPAARRQHPVHVGQEMRREDAAMRLPTVVIGLGVVEVDLLDARRRRVPLEEGLGVLDGEPGVMQAALIGPAGRVPDHHGQDVDGEMVAIRPAQGAQEREPAVAAAEVQDDRCLPAEDRRPVERPGPGQPLDRRPRPLRLREDSPGDRDAQLVFDRSLGHATASREEGRGVILHIVIVKDVGRSASRTERSAAPCRNHRSCRP